MNMSERNAGKMDALAEVYKFLREKHDEVSKRIDTCGAEQYLTAIAECQVFVDGLQQAIIEQATIEEDEGDNYEGAV